MPRLTGIKSLSKRSLLSSDVQSPSGPMATDSLSVSRKDLRGSADGASSAAYLTRGRELKLNLLRVQGAVKYGGRAEPACLVASSKILRQRTIFSSSFLPS